MNKNRSDKFEAYLNPHEKFFVSASFFLMRYIAAPLVRKIWIRKVIGIENIPKSGPVIFTFNHSSYFDFITFLAVCPRNVHYLAAEKFYDSAFWRPIMHATRQIKVERKKKDKRELFKQVYQFLDDGHAIGIFPEGTRAPSDHMIPAYGGVARFASARNVPIVPVGIKGTFQVMSRYDKRPRFKKAIEIIIDRPLHMPKKEHITLNKRAAQVFADGIMQRIAKLVDKAYPFKTHQHPKKKKRIACFDVDETLLNGQSQKYLLDYLYKKKIISRVYYVRIYTWFVLYKIGLVNNPKKVMERAYVFLKNWEVSRVDVILSDFVYTELKQYFYKDMFKTIERHNGEKTDIFIISNLPEPLLKHIAKYVGVDRYYGTKLETLGEKYTGKIQGEITYGVEKVAALYALLSSGHYTLSKSWGYADHFSDRYLLERFSNPVVINPKRNMRRYAEKKKWRVAFIRDSFH